GPTRPRHGPQWWQRRTGRRNTADRCRATGATPGNGVTHGGDAEEGRRHSHPRSAEEIERDLAPTARQYGDPRYGCSEGSRNEWRSAGESQVASGQDGRSNANAFPESARRFTFSRRRHEVDAEQRRDDEDGARQSSHQEPSG